MNKALIPNISERLENLNVFFEDEEEKNSQKTKNLSSEKYPDGNFFSLQEERIFREKMISLRYESQTITQYIFCIRRFMNSGQQFRNLSIESVKDFVEDMSISMNYSRSYQNLLINSIKAYLIYMKGLEPNEIEVQRPKRRPSNPSILSKKEAEVLLNSIKNIKHSALISTIYMTGITAGESVRLRTVDIDRKQMRIFIMGKNNTSGRWIPVSPELLQKLDFYINLYHPDKFLFEGYKGAQYSERIVQKVLKKYIQKAGISGKIHVHSLRHSYAAQLAEKGADLEKIKELLGHRSDRPAKIYTMIAKNI